MNEETVTHVSFEKTVREILTDPEFQRELAQEKTGLTVRLGHPHERSSSDYAICFQPGGKFKIGVLHDAQGWLPGCKTFRLSDTGEIITEDEEPVPYAQSEIDQKVKELLFSSGSLDKILIAVEERKLERNISSGERTQRLLKIERQLISLCQNEQVQNALISLKEDEEMLGEPAIVEMRGDWYFVVSLLPKKRIRVGLYYAPKTDDSVKEDRAEDRWIEKRDYDLTSLRDRGTVSQVLISYDDHPFVRMSGFKTSDMNRFLITKKLEAITVSIDRNILSAFATSPFKAPDRGVFDHGDLSPRDILMSKAHFCEHYGSRLF